MQLSPTSTQQWAVVIDTPRRQPSPLQHSEAAMHIASCMPQAQEPEVHDQSEAVQLISVGPPLVPARQLEEPAHHPQPLRPVQSPQPIASMHGSVGPMLELATQSQSVPEQLPSVGPVPVPRRHEPVSAHQPQT